MVTENIKKKLIMIIDNVYFIQIHFLKKWYSLEKKSGMLLKKSV